MERLLLKSGYFVLCFSVLSCKSRNSVQSKTHLENAVVSGDEAQRAFQIVNTTRDYLPYEYTPDGCYARATYMQMELAVKNIPSQVLFARTSVVTDANGNVVFNPQGPRLGSENWVYHVAPVITVNNVDMVLDPSLSGAGVAGGAMTKIDWLTLMNTKKYSEVPNDDPTLITALKAANPDLGPIDFPDVTAKIITRVEDMPPFSQEMFASNFSILDSYLIQSVAEQRIEGSVMQKRRGLLYSRSINLHKSLLPIKLIVKSSDPTVADFENYLQGLAAANNSPHLNENSVPHTTSLDDKSVRIWLKNTVQISW